MYFKISLFTKELFEFTLLNAFNIEIMKSAFMYSTYEEALEGAGEMADIIGCNLLGLDGELL